MTEDTKQIITVVRLNAPVYKVELIVKINSTNDMRVLNLSFQLSNWICVSKISDFFLKIQVSCCTIKMIFWLSKGVPFNYVIPAKYNLNSKEAMLWQRLPT